MKKEILSIQYLRAIAALLVVYVHALEQFPWLKDIFNTSVGHAGVDLFFVISGFIMVYSTYGKNINGLTFIYHRILRVFPLYWFFTIALIMIALFLPNVLESVKLELMHVIKSFLFIPTFSPVYPERFWPVLIPGWTLNYEMAFYTLFAVSMFLHERFRLFFLSVIMIFLVFLGLKISDTSALSFYTDIIILEFLLGILLGYFYFYFYFYSKFYKNSILGFFIITLGIIYFLFSDDFSTHRFMSAGIASFIIVLGALLVDHSGFKELKFLHLLGNASYSIYLSHVFSLGLYRFIREYVGLSYDETMFNGLFLVFVAIVFSSFVGVIVYYLIEMPINRKLRGKPH